MAEETGLTKALKTLLGLAGPGPAESLPLAQGVGRVAAVALKARRPLPSFDSSTRDGFAVNSRDIAGARSGKPVELKVAGEIPAGMIETPRLRRGKALRIMTGAMVPAGSDLVLPREDIRENGGAIVISGPATSGSHIRRKGCDLRKGRVIVSKGEIITPARLGLLAAAGVTDLEVFGPARIGVICTGSELVPPGSEPAAGRVVSSNSLLIPGLIGQRGGTVEKVAIVGDDLAEIIAELRDMLAGKLQLIITTGGMGPGKFDLVRSAFRQLKLRTPFTSLAIRPGRGTMLGVSGQGMVLALPGTPPAAELMFHELAGPAIGALRGERMVTPRTMRAELAEPLPTRSGHSLRLTGGVLFHSGGRIMARRAEKDETLNCVLHLPRGKRLFRAGEMIAARPVFNGGWG